jgi:hypothetical protein
MTQKGKKLYREFFQKLIEMNNSKTDIQLNAENLEKEWLSTYADKLGNYFVYFIAKKRPSIELSNWGKDREKVIFDALFSQKDIIESELGFSLEWQRNDNKSNWRIRKIFKEGGRDKQDTWPTLQEKMVDAMLKFAQVFRPRLAEIGKKKSES